MTFTEFKIDVVQLGVATEIDTIVFLVTFTDFLPLSSERRCKYKENSSITTNKTGTSVHLLCFFVI